MGSTSLILATSGLAKCGNSVSVRRMAWFLDLLVWRRNANVAVFHVADSSVLAVLEAEF